jgi:integrase
MVRDITAYLYDIIEACDSKASILAGISLETFVTTRENQALAALLFLYRQLLGRDLKLEGVVRARKKRRLPVVMTQAEVREMLDRMDGVDRLVAELMYGGGLRLMEALRLRVQDLDFAAYAITVRDGKGRVPLRGVNPEARLP